MACADRTRRDPAVDVLRAVAIVGVVLGHWMVTGFVAGPGGLHTDSPLRHLPFLAPVSWAAQTLALFFFAGGYANTVRAGRARGTGAGHRTGDRDGGRGRWLAARTGRLTRPVCRLALFWAGLLALLAVAGTPPGTLRTAAKLVASPLWFLAVYLVLTAATPLAVVAVRRFGAAAALGPLLVVAAADLLRFGPVPVPATGWANVLAGWLVPYTLGVAHAAGRLGGRRAGAALAGAGALAAAGLVLLAGYPASMVGVPGAGRSNLNPPSLLVPALAAVQVGLALAGKDRLTALARRPAAVRPVAVLNGAAMTVFLWHQSVLLLTALTGHRVGGDRVFGLLGPPGDLGWVAARAALLPLFAVLLAALVTAGRVAGAGRPAPTTRPAGAPGGQPVQCARTASAAAAPCCWPARAAPSRRL